MKQQYSALFRPAFIVCVVLLTVSAATKSILIEVLGYQLVKFPIDLKKPLDQLDEKKLAPYKVVGKSTITNQDIVESLGTEKYIQWTLEDPTAPADSPVWRCSLFITYYTGNPDMVPHVPDECYVGGGNTRLRGETLTTEIPWPGQEKPREIAMQYVVFGRQEKSLLQADNQFSVQYLFKANGQFCGDRTATRAVLGSNFFGKYSYFAKIEWRFYGKNLTHPTQEETLGATQKLMAVLLPVLEEDHWPDWEKVNQNDVKE
jgi:hypothetical protein